MKIVTWNINSVRIRLSLIEKLFQDYQPDILCLQETKVIDELFPFEFFTKLGYQYLVYSGEKSYNGVAIISKYKIDNSFSIKLYNQDHRHIAAKIYGIEVHNFYVPAGGDIPDITVNPKFKHKLEYISLMQNWFSSNRGLCDKLVIVGDLNIAPHENDVWSSRQLRMVVSHTEPERQSLLQFQNSLNFIDTARHFVPMDKKIYTWWSYRNLDWQKSNRGRRLDHIWVSLNLQNLLIHANSLSFMRGLNSPSDHVPYLIELNL